MIGALAAAVIAMAPGEHEPVVRWRSSGTCSNAGATAQQLTALLGSREAATVLDVVVTARDDRFVAELVIAVDGATVSRSLEATTCEGLSSAIAIVAAVQIDAVAAAASAPIQRAITAPVVIVAPPTSERPPTQGPNQPSTEATPIEARASTPIDDRSASPRTRAVRLAFTVGGGASLRTLPAPATMIRGGASLHVRRARIALDVAWMLDRVARLPAPDEDAGAHIGLRGATLRAGWAWVQRRVEVPLLAGIEVADVSARGIGLSRARVRHGAWVAAVAGVGLAWVPVPAFALVVDPAIAVGIGRPTFGVDAPDRVRRLFRPPVVGLRLGVAVEVRFL